MDSARLNYRRLAVGALVVLVAGVGCGSGSGRGGADTAGESLEGSAARLQGYVADVWPKTSDIWPGVDYSDHVLVVSDGSETWAVTTHDHNEVSQSDLEARGAAIPEQPGGFSFADWDGHKAVVVRLNEAPQEDDDELAIIHVEDPVLDAFGTATHESFHHYVQQADPPWPLPAQSNRGELYPLVAEPRLYRTMVFNSLLEAYREPQQRQDHLAAAAYWNEKWTQEFPDEATTISANDVAEGTAEYFERVAVWMAEADDPGDIAARKGDFVDKLRPLTHRVADVESYFVGLMAILNSEDMGLSDAKGAIGGGATPLSTVLAGVQPAPQEPPTDIVDNISDETAQINEPLAKQIDPLVEALNDPSQWTLMLPVDKQQASLQPGGFYRTKDIAFIITEANQSFGLTGGTITLKDITVSMSSDVPYFVVPLDPEDDNVSLSGDQLVLSGDHIHGSATVEIRTENGKQTLYPT